MKAKIFKTFFAVFFIGLVLPLSVMSQWIPEGYLLDGVAEGPDGMIDVLTVFAHPDDESIYGGGGLIKIKKDPRVRLHILCLGVGDWPAQARELGIDSSQLVKTRASELRSAAEMLGAQEVIQWTILDGKFISRDQEQLTIDIVEVIEKVGAEIVITHDPAGITRNPDHLTCSRVATEAFERSNARRLYYPTLPAPLYKAAMFLMRGEWEGEPVEPAQPTFDVDIREVKDMKRMACYSHASQIFYSDVGPAVKLLLLFPKEYWALAGEKD